MATPKIYIGKYQINQELTAQATIELVEMKINPVEKKTEKNGGPPFTDGSLYTESKDEDTRISLTFRIYETSRQNAINAMEIISRELTVAQRFYATGEFQTYAPLFSMNNTFTATETRGSDRWWHRCIKEWEGPFIESDNPNWLKTNLDATLPFITVRYELLTSTPFDQGYITPATSVGADYWSTETLHNGPTQNYSASKFVPYGSGAAWYKASLSLFQGQVQTVNEVYLALSPQSPALFNFGAVVDAAAYGSTAKLLTVAATPATQITATTTVSATSTDHPCRVIARIRRDGVGGTSNSLKMRWFSQVGTNGQILYSDTWVTFYDNGTTNYYALDLGFVPPDEGRLLTSDSSALLAYGIEYYDSTGGSAYTFMLDYIEIIPYVGFTKMESSNTYNSSEWRYGRLNNVTYFKSGLSANGGSAPSRGATRYYPRTTPACQIDSQTGALLEMGQYFGDIPRIPIGKNYRWWVLVQNRTTPLHDLSNRIDFSCYTVQSDSVGLL